MTADEVDVETGGEGDVAMEETEPVEEEGEVILILKFCQVDSNVPGQANHSETAGVGPRTTAKAWPQVDPTPIPLATDPTLKKAW